MKTFEDLEAWLKYAFKQNSPYWDGSPFRTRFLPYAFHEALKHELRELKLAVGDKT